MKPFEGPNSEELITAGKAARAGFQQEINTASEQILKEQGKNSVQRTGPFRQAQGKSCDQNDHHQIIIKVLLRLGSFRFFASILTSISVF